MKVTNICTLYSPNNTFGGEYIRVKEIGLVFENLLKSKGLVLFDIMTEGN